MDKKAMQKGPGGAAWGLTIVGALLQAFVLAYFTYIVFNFFAGDTSWMNASLITAAMAWGGFQLSMILTHDAFEQRPMPLTMLTAGNQFVTLMAMGLTIGLIGR